MISTKDIGKEVCAVLGLDPKKVRSIQISIDPDEAVIVTVEQYVHLDEFQKVTEVLSNYELVPKITNDGKNLTEYREYYKPFNRTGK